MPLEQWPEGAVKYPLHDARYTLDVHLAQERAASSIPNGGNLHAEADQVRAALALHFASIWGLRTDAGRVEELRRRVEAAWRANRACIQAAGVFRPNGTKDSKRLAQFVTAAYNGASPVTAPRAIPRRPGRNRKTWGRSGTSTSTNRPTWTSSKPARLPVNPRFNVLVCRFSKKPGGMPRITSPCVFPENFSSVGDRRARSRAATHRKSEPGGMPEPSPESARIYQGQDTANCGQRRPSGASRGKRPHREVRGASPMLEQVEQYRPQVIAALTGAGPHGRTVKELCGTLGAGEQAVRRCLAALVLTGEVREAARYTPGARGAVPRAYSLNPRAA
ncbi:hypothetical protein ACJ2CR_29460 [Myxococcus faecalis]|uniref:hypothetical protein n=1 Tax=Myxococcus faecalis TaxID=3115646 RepID=UPI0038D0808D